MKSTEVQHIFESLKEQSTDDVISTRRFIDSFLSSIRSSPIADNQEIDQIVSTFDPSNSGFIDLASFEQGIERLFEKAEDGSGNQSKKMMMSSDTACVESPVEGAAASALRLGQQHQKNNISSADRRFLTPPPQSLLSFDVESYSPLVAEATVSLPESKSQKYSDDLTLLDCSLSAPSWTDSESNMSLVENNKANSQMEEHFEFTPSPEHALKKHEDDADEVDFSYANGDNSYSSLKSATFSSQRNTWMRSSVRRNGRRSSLSYESDEMNADANLEEDVQNLNDQIKKLQEQIEILSEAQMKNEVKYTSMKRENVNLGDKISFLEEHIRDIELQTEERKTEDERRFKESMARLEREKSQELEKYVGQILILQKELFEAKEEVKRHQQTIDALQSNKLDLESIIQEKESEIESLSEEIAKLKDVIRKQSEESHANSTLIEALNHELATIKQSSDLTKLEHHRMVHESEVNNINVELEKQVRSLKEENHSLKESNEELTAQLLNNHLIEGKSLLKEGEAISSLANEISDLNIEQLKTTLKEQQDVNAKLRAYIDGILLNIVENYPQLLEVKSN